MKNRNFHRPVNPFRINQSFGDNQACVNDDKKVIYCDGENPPEGYRSLYGSQGHKGLDLRAGHGQRVYASAGGVVCGIDTNPKSGLDVRIQSIFNGRTYRHIYEHLLGYQPQKGDEVKTGELIGWADNTGYSSGNHLHFQLEEWKDGKWTPKGK